GPCSSNFFFQPYKVCLHIPTKAAKSPAGRPLRCQVSKSSSRCSAVSAMCLPCSFGTNRRPPLFRPDRRGTPDRPSSPPSATDPPPASSQSGCSPTSAVSSSPQGPTAETVGGGAAGGVGAPLRSPSLRSGSLRSAPTPPAAPGCCSPGK